MNEQIIYKSGYDGGSQIFETENIIFEVEALVVESEGDYTDGYSTSSSYEYIEYGDVISLTTVGGDEIELTTKLKTELLCLIN